MQKEEKMLLARTLRAKGKRLKDIAVRRDVSVAPASLHCNGVLPKGKQAADGTLKVKCLDEVLQRYQSGMSMSGISKQRGRLATALYGWRREAGVSRNSRKIYVRDDLRSRTGKRIFRDKGGSLEQQHRGGRTRHGN